MGMSKGFGPPPPALFTRMESFPKRATAASTSATSAFSSVTFTASPAARPPAATILAATASAALPSRLLTTTAAPAPANVVAMALPMPAPAPVTTATSPSSRNAFGFVSRSHPINRPGPGVSIRESARSGDWAALAPGSCVSRMDSGGGPGSGGPPRFGTTLPGVGWIEIVAVPGKTCLDWPESWKLPPAARDEESTVYAIYQTFIDAYLVRPRLPDGVRHRPRGWCRRRLQRRRPGD